MHPRRRWHRSATMHPRCGRNWAATVHPRSGRYRAAAMSQYCRPIGDYQVSQPHRTCQHEHYEQEQE